MPRLVLLPERRTEALRGSVASIFSRGAYRVVDGTVVFRPRWNKPLPIKNMVVLRAEGDGFVRETGTLAVGGAEVTMLREPEAGGKGRAGPKDLYLAIVNRR